ncbi:hypothetical protein N7533_004123 [Penicillium manginii]|uniref:uncharacterized protein n=1 Tax=Penicillium manginii TaxID=203109 RepID=UPI002546D5DE|nr:uncharacterized protein N7533_004123 [Penicillium manginii]KAJ5754580.1 hypothetical protein N7533_004123 [Penicillium manginii]
MDDIAQSKPGTEAVEYVKPGLLQQLPLPAELGSLGSDEIEQLEKGLVRRLDTCLLPSVVILFLMNILDRNNIANAKIAGLPDTLGITNTQYNTCLMIFYVGYILTQLPSNLIITKVRPSIYIGTVTAAWGVVSMCQAFTRNFAGLFLSRFVLGMVEGPFLPGGILPHVLLEWLFIIEGSMTIAIAFLVIVFIPDYPGTTKRWWMDREYQLLADWRLRNENAGLVDDDPGSLLWGVKQALLDPKLYMFIVLQMALLTAQSFNNFFPSIVGTLGYNETITLLLTAPPYAFAFVCSLTISFHAAHKQERGFHIAIPLLFAFLGNLLAMFVPSTGGRYFSMFLMTAGSYSPYNLCVSWLSSTLPRPKAKRASALAIVNLMGAGVAHFYTSYIFPDSQKPRYYAGGGVMSGACLVCALMALGIKWHLKKQNVEIERAEMEEGAVASSSAITGTARADGVVSFRYVH